ncbi:MAG TPA: NAD-dependent epimerase/dehydratase family protein [Acetobacteraceae bacterium]|nr:NAD-dependent epimerase/dehydratase family protein [Acetobacteraceae bacterium]
MQISILGGGGFLGRKIAARLIHDGRLGDQPVTGLTLFDLAAPPKPQAPFPVTTLGGDLVDLPPGAIPPATDVIFHLAAVVSAQAEADYDLGRRVNLRGTDAVVDACRRQVASGGRPPRVVFTSSVASFSGGQDAVLDDDARQVPSNSYGAQKAAAELILADASRRGFLDAVSIRLPTVIVRPGRPNRAASSFFSAIVREPLLGLTADLPVPDDFAAWVCSPRRAVDWLLHAAAMDTSTMGLDRSVTPPGISTTIAHLLQALDQVKTGASALVRRVADKEIAAIIGLWPPTFEPGRARTLGFTAHEPVVEVIRAFVEDDLDATRQERGLPSTPG